jgi:hypothetical protein
LLQQADPSAGWAQQAPSLSFFDSLGVQQTAALSFGVQHDAAGALCFFSIVDFCRTGMFKMVVFIVFVFL